MMISGQLYAVTSRLKRLDKQNTQALSEQVHLPNKYICGLLKSEKSSSIFVVGGYTSVNWCDGHMA